MAEFADTLRELVKLYRESLLMPNARAVDPTMGGYGTNINRGTGGHGAHGERGRILRFGAEAPFSERLAAWLARTVAYWRYEMDRERRGVENAVLPEALVELAQELHGIASTRDGDQAARVAVVGPRSALRIGPSWR